MKIVAQFGFDYSVQCILHGGSLYQYDFTADWKLPPLLPQLSSISSRSSIYIYIGSSLTCVSLISFIYIYIIYINIMCDQLWCISTMRILLLSLFHSFKHDFTRISAYRQCRNTRQKLGRPRSAKTMKHRDAQHFQTVQHAAAPKYNTIMDLSRYRSHCLADLWPIGPRPKTEESNWDIPA